MKLNRITSLILFGLSGCASTYNILSNPEGASVYYNEPESGRKVYLGVTPLSYNKSSLPQEKAFTVTISKDGFKPLDVPVASNDQSKTIISVKLKTDEQTVSLQAKQLNQLMDRMSRIQQMIYAKKMQSAIFELDQVIKENPEFAQAYVMRGTCYFILKEIGTAKQDWRTALKLNPQNPELLKFLSDHKIALERTTHES